MERPSIISRQGIHITAHQIAQIICPAKCCWQASQAGSEVQWIKHPRTKPKIAGWTRAGFMVVRMTNRIEVFAPWQFFSFFPASWLMACFHSSPGESVWLLQATSGVQASLGAIRMLPQSVTSVIDLFDAGIAAARSI